MPLFVQRPDGSLTPYVYGTPVGTGETIVPLPGGPNWIPRGRGRGRGGFGGRGRGNWSNWRNPGDQQQRGRSQNRERSRSRSRSRSRRFRLSKAENTGGRYRGEVPCDWEGHHSGAQNNRHPHQHKDEDVIGQRPGDFQIPSRSRFLSVEHVEEEQGITKHVYTFFYLTKKVDGREYRKGVKFNGKIEGLTETLGQVEI
nr:MAG: hypothetical protein [Jingmen bat astrovirus 1]